jgi:uncharacterized protein YdaU (DUF1376 family)
VRAWKRSCRRSGARAEVAKDKEPYLPLFFGDFLAATAFWSGEEQGLYLLLLGYQWSSGPLPFDPAQLATAVRYEPKNFSKLWKRVGTKFVRAQTGLINERLEEVRVKARQISRQNSDAGKQGAAARWRKDSERHAGANGEQMANAIETPMAEGMAPGCSSNPIQSGVKSKKLTRGENEEKEPLQ